VSFVRDHLAERRATFGEHDLIAEALNRGMGKVSLSELEAAIQVDPELVRLDQQKNAIAVLTNQTNLRLERRSCRCVRPREDTSSREVQMDFGRPTDLLCQTPEAVGPAQKFRRVLLSLS
jgi:hypothetical protein